MKPLLALAFALFLNACSTLPAPADSEAAIHALPLPDTWHNAPKDAPSNHSLSHAQKWWLYFQQPQLNQLIEQAFASNLELAISAYQQQLTQLRHHAPAALNQQLSGQLREQSPALTVAYHTSYEIDFWQKRPLEASSRAHHVLASEQEWLAMRLSVSGQVAKQLLTLSYLQAQHNRAQAQLAHLQRQQTRLNAQLRLGKISQLNLLQSQQALVNVEKHLTELEAQLNQGRLRFGYLLGQTSAYTGAIPDLSSFHLPDVPKDLPAHLLRHRPDLRALQHRLQTQLNDIALAERDFYPSFNLSAGLNSATLASSLQNPLGLVSVGIHLPFLKYPELERAKHSKTLSYEEQLKQYQLRLYRAIEEVEQALAQRAQSAQAHQRAQTHLRQQQRIQQLIALRYQHGAESLQSLQNAQEQTLIAEFELLSQHYQQLIHSIELYLALGGSTQD